ncbi:MAG: molybdopterin-binding protein, partial [Alphaproteobacteria bacterium]
ILPLDLRQGSNYRPKGENIAKGDIAIAQGTKLGPSEIGLLAAIGTTQIKVARRLTVTILSMGDEIAEAGSKAGFDQGKIHDSNRPMLKQLLRLDGHDVVDGGIIRDDPD